MILFGLIECLPKEIPMWWWLRTRTLYCGRSDGDPVVMSDTRHVPSVKVERAGYQQTTDLGG